MKYLGNCELLPKPPDVWHSIKNCHITEISTLHLDVLLPQIYSVGRLHEIFISYNDSLE